MNMFAESKTQTKFCLKPPCALSIGNVYTLVNLNNIRLLSILEKISPNIYMSEFLIYYNYKKNRLDVRKSLPNTGISKELKQKYCEHYLMHNDGFLFHLGKKKDFCKSDSIDEDAVKLKVEKQLSNAREISNEEFFNAVKNEFLSQNSIRRYKESGINGEEFLGLLEQFNLMSDWTKRSFLLNNVIRINRNKQILRHNSDLNCAEYVLNCMSKLNERLNI